MTIKPELFDIVSEYLDQPVSDTFATDHPLVMFCENLQSQLSSTVTGKEISGFNERNYRRMKSVSRRLTKQGHRKGALVALALANLNTRVLEDDYSMDDYYSEWLHNELLPDLLWRFGEHAADELADPTLKNKVDEVRAVYVERFGLE